MGMQVDQAAPTSLHPEEESKFQDWIKGTDWYKEFVRDYKETPNLNDPQYDYRAAWKAGVQPERDPYDKNRYHWPSALPSGQMLKGKEHPTLWMEEFMKDTGVNPEALGLKNPKEAEPIRQQLKQQRSLVDMLRRYGVVK